ncbi:hypothetical protein PsYK624_160920 [Phanerochaete sordida]|uniref:F-box domain-containing protein n=1 Tax=Phanerochaete sordida TaxID=48140 RepID=A0A9P3LLX6_9APHY|nr:hypothetical protein PsYK624_160920 [Phanerochaete sordida]
MHQFFEIPEITQRIAERLALLPSARKSWILSMAKTCKATYEPSMDVLWRELAIFTPLLRCLPPTVLKYRIAECWPGARMGTWEIVKDPLSESDMARFKHHARRVHIIRSLTPQATLAKRPDSSEYVSRLVWGSRRPPWEAPEFVGAYIAPECFEALESFFKSTPALPALRELTCDHPDLDEPRHLAPFMSPVLSTLTYDRSEAHFSVKDAVAELNQAQCKNSLTKLVLDTRGPSESIAVGNREMAVLASLPRLQWLRCFVDPQLDHTQTFQHIPENPFPSLYTLILRTDDDVRPIGNDNTSDATYDALATFIRCFYAICAPKRLMISVYGHMQVSHAAVLSLFDALAELHGRVSSLCISLYSGARAGQPPLTLADLAPILPLPVRDIELLGLIMDIGLDDVLALVGAWPRVRCLALGHAHHETAPRVPLAGLPQLAQAMTSLEPVQIGLVVENDSPLPATPPAPMFHVTEVNLGVSHITGRNLRRAAAFLVHCFPNAELVLYGPRGMERDTQWGWENAVKTAKRTPQTSWHDMESESEDEAEDETAPPSDGSAEDARAIRE